MQGAGLQDPPCTLMATHPFSPSHVYPALFFRATQADSRYLVATIKHSGSLVTLSALGWASKNSLGNEYTAGGCGE